MSSRLVRAIAGTAVAGGLSRVVSFAYYVGAARLLEPAGFGVVRYTITLALAVFGPLQVLTHAISREVGASRQAVGEQEAVLGTSIFMAPLVLLVLIACCAGAAAAGLLHGASVAGLCVALVGLTAFQIYSGVARGLGRYRRAAFNDLFGGVVQLGALGVVALFASPDPLVLLVVFGASSFVPLIGYELLAPIVRGRPLRVDRAAARRLLRIAGPLLVAEILFYTWLTADQVWVEQNLSRTAVGVYGVAKTVVMLMVILPTAMTAVLLPRLAELTTAGERRRAANTIRYATFGALGISLLLAGAVAPICSFVLHVLFGAVYQPAAPALRILLVGMAFFAAFSVLALSMVGAGRPVANLIGVAVAAGAEVLYLALVPADSLQTVAWGSAGSIALGFVIMLAYAGLTRWGAGGDAVSLERERGLSQEALEGIE